MCVINFNVLCKHFWYINRTIPNEENCIYWHLISPSKESTVMITNYKIIPKIILFQLILVHISTCISLELRICKGVDVFKKKMYISK